ncbi:MAG: xanthine dehydrogenase family protein molybdopterin-binding subunit [Candidatus Micrarchaeaceae archaeon]
MERLERFVSGKGNFVDDIKEDNILYMAVVRSPYARAKISSIKGGMTYKDIDAVLTSVGEGAAAARREIMHPVFAKGYVNYVGQPVAAVFADTREMAEDLVESVEVEYEPLKPVERPEEAMESEPIHSSMKSNVLSDKHIGKDFKIKADIVLEDRLENRRVATNAIEPRGILAKYDGGRLVIHVSTQSVFSIRRGIAGTLNIPEEKLRVVQADTGGGFGLKGGLQPEYPIAAFASMKYRRPVKWIETRSEHLMAANQGRGAIGKMKLHANRNGKILGIEGEIIVDAGAYAGGLSEFGPSFIAMQLTGQYGIEHGSIRCLSVFTNKVPYGPYRGAGRPEAAFFMERMVDMLADELHMDDAKIRLLNGTDKPFKSPLGLEIDASRPFMKAALKSLGYGKRGNANEGLCFFVLVPGAAPGESARMLVKEGIVHVWLGSNPHGQGHEFFVKKLVSEELGIPRSKISLETPDTDMIKSGVGTWGSRSAIVGGAAAVTAASNIKQQVIQKNGKYSPKALLEGEYDYFGFYKFEGSLNSFGANSAIAEIGDAGEIKVREVRAYYDVGRALDINMVKAQIMGGIVQGVGQAISEEAIYDENGQLLTSSISNAGLLRAPKVPAMHISIAQNASMMPHRAKGLGEAPTIGTPAAVVRSIEKAAKKRIRSTPVRQEDL